MDLSAIDLTIIAGYLFFIITLGIWYGRKEENLEDYFLGGRRVAWIAVLLSIVATETSALTFIGTPAFAYNHNWTYIQLLIGAIIARFIIAKLFIKQFYRYKVYTVYEYLSKRFGTGSKNCASIVFLITRVLASGVRLFGASIIVSVATGLSPLTSIIIIATAAVLYTAIGGIKAVIWTDVCQAILLFGGGLIALFFIFRDIPNGWEGVINITRGLSKFKLFDFSFSHKAAYTIWAGIIGSTFFTLATHGTDQDLVQRMLTAKDYNRSKRALILSGFADIPIVILFLSIGSLLFAYYQAIPTPGLPEKADDIFPYYIVHHVPKGLAGLLIASVFAAAMSSIDSALNSLSTTWINDFYRPYIKKDASERHYLTMAKIFTAFFGFFLILIAFLSRDTQQVLILGLKIGTFTYGALLGIFLLGLLTEKGNDVGNAISIVVSIVAVLFINFYTEIAWVWYVMIGTIITFSVGYLFPAEQNNSHRNTKKEIEEF
jgi:SSS family solute:Na+ symporter